MSNRPAKTSGPRFGSVLKQERKRLGWSQEEVAHLGRTVGLDWTEDVVSMFETGRRTHVTVDEWFGIAEVLGVPKSRFFPEIRREERAAHRVADLRAAGVTGPILDTEVTATEAERHAARVLMVSTEVIRAKAFQLWSGRRLDQERDRRVASLRAISASERQARRGHVTRELLTELSGVLKEKRK
ncbi:MAG TPA: helix-turn-helix transcriptional regulator [Candidatus Nitrosopolaris sp.]|nr:helix-turn-helix transcriptional regulator [Candidatus Nitrosopolaris sp.]